MGFKLSVRDIFVSLVVLLTAFYKEPIVLFSIRSFFDKTQFNALPEEYRIIIIQASGLLIVLVVTFLLAQFSIAKWKDMLGLDKGFVTPAVYATIACMPMLIGCALLHGHQPDGTFKNVLLLSIWPGINEEVVYRIFLVGMLVRFANWNFVVAALLSGLLFAKGHLYQAGDSVEAIKIFVMVSGVGIGFSVLCWMWNWNLWFTVFMHTLMNMAFVLFIAKGNVLLSPADNILRVTTILIAILFTVFYRVMCFRKNAIKA